MTDLPASSRTPDRTNPRGAGPDPVLVLREALAKATEGPWEVQRNDVKGFDIWKQRGTYVAAGLMDGAIEDKPDADLIVAARNLLPVLLDEVEALRKVVDGVKALTFLAPRSILFGDGLVADLQRLLAVLDKEEEK